MAALVGACASAPRPQVLDQAAATARAPALVEAQQLAPQAYAHAQKLERRAEQAHADGDAASAQILGEHALAAYEHAAILARLAKAEQRLGQARTDVAKTGEALRQIEAEQRKVAALAEQLELELKVARDAEPLSPSEPASAEREAARLQAAKALLAQARLLCASAALVGSADAGKQLSVIAQLEGSPGRPHEALDRARAERSTCLQALTLARRDRVLAAPAKSGADALLSKLSAAGLYPFRDDRGVVVTLHEPFAAGSSELKAPARQRLLELGQVAKAHGDFPVLVVAHSARAAGVKQEDARASAVAEILREGGAPKVDTVSVGTALPVLDPKARDAASRNERVEIVFVAPAG